ncbi:hypothetical protein SDC9_116074 [bioreactor metagenome]|uniref:Uncharacterized protein n=1 Tax=bioreactor metagenome TaxID=1076179 RepID=A0A645BUK6_9ZZZZ
MGKRAHDGYQQLSLAVKRPYGFFFKKYLHLAFLEASDGGEAVHGIACEAADALGDDQVDLAGKSIGDHLLESLAPVGTGAADAFVGIDANEFPLSIGFDHGGVVIDLCLVGGELVVPVG